MLHGAFAGLAVVAILLSGCVATDAPRLADPSDASAEATPAAFRTQFLDDAHPGKEPALAIGPDGTVYVCAILGLGGGSHVWRSIDDGASFDYVGETRRVEAAGMGLSTPPLRSAGALGGGDCDMATDAGGRAYLVHTWGVTSSVESSSDRGATWEGVPVSQAGAHMDRPWVLGGQADEVFVLGAHFQATGWEEHGAATPPPGGLIVSRSTDGGRTFPQQVLAVTNQDRIGLQSNLALGAGTLYFVYTAKVAEDRFALMLARSADRGATWTTGEIAQQPMKPDTSFPLTIFPSIGADEAGHVYLTWVLADPERKRHDLYFASSNDQGAQWTEPALLTDREGTRLYPWLAVGPKGEVGLVWYETNVTSICAPDEVGSSPVALTCSYGGLDDAAWYLRHATMERPWDPRPSVIEALADPEPVATGGSWGFDEAMKVAFDAEGRAVIAYIADREDGRSYPKVAIEILP